MKEVLSSSPHSPFLCFRYSLSLEREFILLGTSLATFRTYLDGMDIWKDVGAPIINVYKSLLYPGVDPVTTVESVLRNKSPSITVNVHRGPESDRFKSGLQIHANLAPIWGIVC